MAYLKISYEGADVLIIAKDPPCMDENDPEYQNDFSNQIHAFIACNKKAESALYAISCGDPEGRCIRSVFGFTIYGTRSEVEHRLKARNLSIYHGFV